MSLQTQTNDGALPTAAKPRKGPRPSAETIRKRVQFLIGSGNVKELDEAGYAVVPASLLIELIGFAPVLEAITSSSGADPHE